MFLSQRWPRSDRGVTLFGVHLSVGQTFELVVGKPVIRINRGTNAGTAVQQSTFYRKRRIEAAHKALDDFHGLGAIPNHGNKSHEFITTDASQGIHGPKAFGKPLRNVLQVAVANPMAIDIVHFLESVQVYVDDGTVASGLPAIVRASSKRVSSRKRLATFVSRSYCERCISIS